MLTKLKSVAVAMLLSMLPLSAIQAAEWINVTDEYLVNPYFDGTINGWNNTITNYQNGGYQGAYYSNGNVWISGFAETWIPSPNMLGSGEFSQTTILPAGKYRLSADAIATFQSSWWEQGSSNVTGVSLFAKPGNGARISKKITTADGAPQHFYVDFTVASKQEVALGIYLQNPSANWVAADNFQLEIYGELIPIVGISLDQTNIEMELGSEQQLIASTIPANATYQGMFWYSSDESVARVDNLGNVTAVGEGAAVIYAVSTAADLQASCDVTVTFTPPSAEALVINEIQSSNIDMFMDPSYNYGGWIELYNPTDKDVQLAGLYISDDAANLKKHRLSNLHGLIPAHGFKNLWFDHYGEWNLGELAQINLKLNYDGGSIIISDGTNILAQQTYPAGISRTSYARTTNGGDTWLFSGTPTPEATNSGMDFASQQLADPVIDTDACFFTGTKTVTVTIPEGCTLRYTEDGSTPTLTNGITSENGSFRTTSSKVYRFRLFKDGYLPSNPIARSYINNNRGNKLPTISLSTERSHIYGSELGLFSSGSQTKGRAGNGQDQKCNWNMEWDRPVNFEYFDFDKDGKPVPVFSQEVDMAMCGGWSRAWNPHSFKLKASKQYQGKNSMDYQFFDEKPFLKHKTLQIRNGGNDTEARLKDPALQQIVASSGLYVDAQCWKPVNVFINGNFYAVLNMREPNNKHFAYANYGIDTDLMDQFEMSPDSAYNQMEGTRDAWEQLMALSYDAADNAIYDSICNTLLDIDEYINYIAVELYLCNWDWPQNNLKGFRDREGGKFHFVLFDLDGSFNNSTPFSGFSGKEYYTFDPMRGVDAYGNSIADRRKYNEQIEFVTLFKNLLKNERFKRHFVDAYSIIGGAVFEPSRCSTIITAMEKQLTDNGVNSSNTASTLRSILNSSRQTTMINALKKDGMDFGVGNKTAQTVKINCNVEGSHILINGLPVPMSKMSGPMFGPITVEAVTPAGYEFKGWKTTTGGSVGRKVQIFEAGEPWQYYDGGSLDGKTWKNVTTSGISWKSGNAPLGYDYADPNAYPNKPRVTTETKGYNPTYYFRKTFNIDNIPAAKDVLTLNYTLDDGMILYVNGTEIGRDNMPSGSVSYNSFSSTYAEGNPNTGTMEIPASAIVKGENVIAVEVHNNSGSSSDVFWDAELSMVTYSTENGGYVSTDPVFHCMETGSVALQACFERIDDRTSPVKINEISAGNTMYVNDYFKKDDWVELYNTTAEPVDVNGWYISDNLAKPKKFQITSANGQQTVIPANGHLVIWASKRDAIGEQTHISFKLGNNDGEHVLLTSADGNYTDTLTYVAHGGQESIGLYPDGSNEVCYFSRPTIGFANALTSYTQYLYTKHPSFNVLYGDVNSDGEVNVFDIVALGDYILNGSGYIDRLAADVNNDGSIDVFDVVTISEIILETQQ